jgi:hypothetical protein
MKSSKLMTPYSMHSSIQLAGNILRSCLILVAKPIPVKVIALINMDDEEAARPEWTTDPL